MTLFFLYFAECVDEGEIIVVLFFADLGCLWSGFGRMHCGVETLSLPSRKDVKPRDTVAASITSHPGRV